MLGPDNFGQVMGDAGYITVAGAKAATVSKWVINRSGTRPDKTPRLRFRAQFSWFNETLMNLRMNGQPVKKRIIVQMKTRHGLENVDILDWEESRFEGGVLTLDGITHFEGAVKR